ncbi:MAG: hypothetical protein V4710_10495 [Verrucomicrobiota bacterium]
MLVALPAPPAANRFDGTASGAGAAGTGWLGAGASEVDVAGTGWPPWA